MFFEELISSVSLFFSSYAKPRREMIFLTYSNQHGTVANTIIYDRSVNYSECSIVYLYLSCEELGTPHKAYIERHWLVLQRSAGTIEDAMRIGCAVIVRKCTLH